MCSWGGSGKVHSGERGIHPKTGFPTTDANQGGRPPGQGSFGSSYRKQASKQERERESFPFVCVEEERERERERDRERERERKRKRKRKRERERASTWYLNGAGEPRRNVAAWGTNIPIVSSWNVVSGVCFHNSAPCELTARRHIVPRSVDDPSEAYRGVHWS